MTTNESELFQFNEFVAGKLQNGGDDLTPEQCLEIWRLQHPKAGQFNQSVKSIQSAIDEMESGADCVRADEHHSRLRSKYSGSTE